MIDFFEGETEINSEFFGICDDPDTGVKTPAYIDSDIGNENKWTAVVNNHSKAPVYFNPIDNNIEIKRENGEKTTIFPDSNIDMPTHATG